MVWPNWSDPFIYTLICLAFDRQTGGRCCRYIFGSASRIQDLTLMTAKYAVVTILLAGTATFDVLMFYDPDAASNAFFQALGIYLTQEIYQTGIWLWYLILGFFPLILGVLVVINTIHRRIRDRDTTEAVVGGSCLFLPSLSPLQFQDSSSPYYADMKI